MCKQTLYNVGKHSNMRNNNAKMLENTLKLCNKYVDMLPAHENKPAKCETSFSALLQHMHQKPLSDALQSMHQSLLTAQYRARIREN